MASPVTGDKSVRRKKNCMQARYRPKTFWQT